MTDLEKIQQLLNSVKNCPDTDILVYWQDVCTLFLTMGKAERDKCAPAFYRWAEENISIQPLKFYYAEFFLTANYMLNEEYEPALQLVTKAQKSFAEVFDNDGVALCSLLTGVIYRSLGNFDLSLKTLIKPFEYFKQTGRYPIFLEGSCNSLGNVNLELHNYEEAFSIFSTGYESSLKTGNYFFNIYALQGMGKIKMQQNKFAEAKDFFNKALEVAEKNNSPMHISNAFTELANFDFQTGNLTEAEQLNKQASAIREKNNFTGGIVTNCINLGKIYIKQARWDDAIGVLNKGLALAEQMKVKPKMYPIHLLLSKIYKSKNDLEKSLHHYEIFHELQEKVQEEDNARKLADAKLIFEAEQTKKENIIIKKQKEEIQKKNFELQETIDELTLAKVSRKAKALTLGVAIIMFIFEDPIIGFALKLLSSDNYWLELFLKMAIIFSLSPINKTIEHYLLKKVIMKKKESINLSIAVNG